MPTAIIYQPTIYIGGYTPSNSSATISYQWEVVESDGETLIDSEWYNLISPTTLTSSTINVSWQVAGDYYLKLTVTQTTPTGICGTEDSNLYYIKVLNDNITADCINYSYNGGSSGGVLQYTECGGSVVILNPGPNETSTFCALPNSITTSGTVLTGEVSVCNPPNAVQRAQPIFVGVWGNSGEPIAGGPWGQGTDEDERYMLSQPDFAEAAPFYAVRGVNEDVETSNFVINSLGQSVEVFPKTVRTVTMKYLLQQPEMERLNNYMIKAGVQGYHFLYYAEDAPLKNTREQFVALPNKRGMKFLYSVENMGGGYESFPSPSTYVNSINTIVSHMQMAEYHKINGKPVLLYGISQYNITNSPDKRTEMFSTISRIKDAYRTATGNPSAEFYLVLLGIPALDNDGWFQNYGFDACTNYYIEGNYTDQDFSEIVTNTHNYMISHLSGGKRICPVITVGLDTRARSWLYSGGVNGGSTTGNYYTASSVYANLGTLINNVVSTSAAYSGLVDIIFANMLDEHTEQATGGACIMPTLRNNGSINDTVNRIMQGILNPGFV